MSPIACGSERYLLTTPLSGQPSTSWEASERVEEVFEFEKEALRLLVVDEVAGTVDHHDLGLWVT